MQDNPNRIYLPDVVGKNYAEFWKYKGRYRVLKGSRASKKSKTTPLNYIYGMMHNPKANLLCVRKVADTLRTSVFVELQWAIKRLGVQDFWKVTTSPMEMTYLPTGQKIYFRGFDDPLKITSIAVEEGHLCWVWIEEGYEINDESAFDMLDESIRGDTGGLHKQITITLNPWNDRHWIKSRFFDKATKLHHENVNEEGIRISYSYLSEDNDIMAMTTNYLCNEFLDDADRKVFNRMKEDNPRRYQVAGLGNWGVVDGLIFDNWEERDFNYLEILSQEGYQARFGLDFGYTNDPSALWCGVVNPDKKEIWVFDEMYEKALLNMDITKHIMKKGYMKEKIVADSAEPKSIAEIRGQGVNRIRSARKGKDSVLNGIQYIQGYKIYIHPKCVNFLTEISNYQWDKDKFGKSINKPIDEFNHLMDAMRYAMEDLTRGSLYEF